MKATKSVDYSCRTVALLVAAGFLLMMLECFMPWGGVALCAAADALAEPASLPLPTSVRVTIPYLGRHPELPTHPELLPTVSLQTTAQETGFAVATTSRELSRNFFNALYPASENIPFAWTGDLATCSAGTTAELFKEAVQLRVNYFRAMAGVPAAISFSRIYSVKNQQSAQMMSANNSLSHSPPSSWSCYTADGYEAAGNSNLALGASGADSISKYVLDHGANNSAAGHRRWLLYPQTQIMGTGDTPVTTGHASANALWVFDGNYGNPRPVTRDDFVAWPPPGYVPYQVMYPRWSLSYPGADFSNAAVIMTRSGASIPVRLEPLTINIGENSLVWVPDNLDTNSVNSFPRPVADTIYTVKVGNVLVGGAPRSFSYAVTLFDPQTAGADHISATVTGLNSLHTGSASPYSITPVPGADSYQWRYAGTTTPSAYGAESGLTGMSVSVPPGYTPLSTDIHASGSASYHLTQPDFADQTLSLDPVFLPGTMATLSFRSRLGSATAAQTATVEVSADDGSTWEEVYRQTGTGDPGEQTFTLRTINLVPYAGRTIRIRFAYRYTMGEQAYTQSTTGFGWYLDDIALADTRELSGVTLSTAISAPLFTFTAPVEGSYVLQARALLYGRYPLEWSPVLAIYSLPPLLTVNPMPSVTGFPGLELSGTTETGATVMVQLNGGIPQPATITGTAWTISISSLRQGNNIMAIAAVDPAGETLTLQRGILFSPAIPGDLNGDNAINVFDALLALQYAVGLYKPAQDASFKILADVAPLDTTGKPKGDGVVNVFDALAILRRAVGLDVW